MRTGDPRDRDLDPGIEVMPPVAAKVIVANQPPEIVVGQPEFAEITPPHRQPIHLLKPPPYLVLKSIHPSL